MSLKKMCGRSREHKEQGKEVPAGAEWEIFLPLKRGV
jgi:hypothetical protein